MEIHSSLAMPSADSDEFARMLAALAEDTAPRRFALCEVDAEAPDGWVIAWGLAGAENAAVIDVEECSLAKFQSPESAQSLYSRVRECRLVWIDAPKADPERDVARA